MKETARLQSVALLLAGATCLLPFLVPYHQQPVLSFYPEWLAVALGVCTALAALAWRGAPGAPIPAPALWLIAFALYLLARMLGPGQAYPQIGLLAALYVLFAALMIWLGAQLANTFGAERVVLVLAAFLLAGALVNSLAAVIQFYGRPELLEDVVAQLRGNRAYGNIAQPNLYANYLALGQCALIFLWLRRRMRTGYALAAAAFLSVGSALSGSRGALIFAGWIVLLGALAGHLQPGLDARRFKRAAYFVAGCVLAVHFGLPWLNDAFQLGPPSEGALDRALDFWEQGSEPRWKIYALALRVSSLAPIIGVGVGGFAGAAFELGLDPSLTRAGEVLTSPHDLPLHLLAETGVVGVALALGSLGVWGWQIARRFPSSSQPALWWVVAATGVEVIHSLFEFPMWSAHFLGVTALLMGVGVAPGVPSRPMFAAGRIAAVGSCALLLFALAMLLRDYVRLDTTRITGSAVTLASPAEARRDAATLRGLGHGLLAPLAELWIVIGAPLDRSDWVVKLAMSERVASFWPSHAVMVRRAALLALNGDANEAQALLHRALRTFPHLGPATIAILQNASSADADALEPLLVVARKATDDSSGLANDAQAPHK